MSFVVSVKFLIPTNSIAKMYIIPIVVCYNFLTITLLLNINIYITNINIANINIKSNLIMSFLSY